MESCKDRPQKCLICAGLHKVENYWCRVAGCNKAKRKICTYINLKYANYDKIHIANSPCCASKYQIDIKARKEKEKEKM